MVLSLVPKLGNVLSPVVLEIRFPVYVLSVAKTECHQPVSRADGEIRNQQGFHKAVWGHLTTAGFSCSTGRQAGHSP